MSTSARIGLAAMFIAGSGDLALAQSQSDRGGCMGYFMDGGYGHMFFGGILMLFFWAGLIALIALAVKWVASGQGGSGIAPASGSTPRQILEERFARGEIDKDEFESRKKALAG